MRLARVLSGQDMLSDSLSQPVGHLADEVLPVPAANSLSNEAASALPGSVTTHFNATEASTASDRLPGSLPDLSNQLLSGTVLRTEMCRCRIARSWSTA